MKPQAVAYLTALTAAGCALALVGCTGIPTVDGQPAITVVADHLALFSTQLSNALQDGIVTPEEGSAIQRAFQELGGKMTLAIQSAGGANWGEVLATVGASVATTLLGVKVLPTRALMGPFDGKA